MFINLTFYFSIENLQFIKNSQKNAQTFLPKTKGLRALTQREQVDTKRQAYVAFRLNQS